jgi:hypothetical protein
MNKLTEEVELLTIFAEECSEAAIEAAKQIRFGNSKIESEVGDLMCMINLLHEKGYINMDNVAYCTEAKRNKLKQWSNLNGL